MTVLSPINKIAYRTEAIAQFEQKEALLRDTVTVEDVEQGATATFTITGFAGKQAVSRDLNGLIPGDSVNRSHVNLRERHFAPEHTAFDVFSSATNMKKAMDEAISVIYRDMDDAIITALNGANTQIMTSASLTLADVAKAKATLSRNNAGKDVTFLLTPAAMLYLLQLPAFTSQDYVKDNKYGSSDAMARYNWLGINFIMHPNLPGVGTNAAKCFMYSKYAIGHAMSRAGLDFVIGYDERHDYHFTRASATHAALVLQPSGIIEITHDDTGLTI